MPGANQSVDHAGSAVVELPIHLDLDDGDQRALVDGRLVNGTLEPAENRQRPVIGVRYQNV